MEGRLKESIGMLDCAVKRREKRSRDYSSTDDDQEDSKQGIIPLIKDNKLEQAKAEMGEVKEENQRLKKYLNQIMEDYKNLQKKFREALDHQHESEAKESASTVTTTNQERDIFSLCLGRSTAASGSDVNRNPNKDRHQDHGEDDDKEGLALGLSSTMQSESPANVSSADNSVEEVNIREETIWPPGKALKKAKNIGEEEAPSQQNIPAKKARVSVRVRCDTPTMNDGCQWRKYGQKIAKGNPCPRAYYRCTVSTTCPVRKQVQRCAQDMSILITTYEGTHNHPLAMSATTMAATTSAAASMLMSGSSTSGQNPNNPSSMTTPAELQGLNFYFSDGSKTNPYYPQNHPLVPSPSCPTITLDLTSNNISSSSSSLFNRPTHPSNNFLPRYSTTNLNFSSWNNINSNGAGTFAYGNNSQPYIKNQIGSVNFGRHPQQNVYHQSYMQKNMAEASSSTQQSLQASTIEAATKTITSDPNFQSALQAALSSIINSSHGIGHGGGGGGGSGGDTKLGQNSTSKSKSISPEKS